MKRTTLKIVVVDDSRADFVRLERHLKQHGLAAQCRCVASEAELHAAIAQGGCDVILADCNVPNLDFDAMLAACQARYPDLPLILVSGSIGEERANIGNVRI